MAIFDIKTRKQKLEEDIRTEGDKRDTIREKQQGLGYHLMERLSDAARENRSYNVMRDGMISECFGPLEVCNVRDNGGKNTTLVYVLDSGSWNSTPYGQRCQTVAQVDIDVQRGVIHTFKPKTGEDRDYPLNAFESVAGELTRYVREFRLFG